MKKNSHIFITGANGLLGSKLVQRLLREGYHNLTALKRRDSNLALLSGAADEITWVESDLRDLSYWNTLSRGRPIDCIIHCAAIVSFDPRDKNLMMDINIAGTENLVNFALENAQPKFIYISSVSAIGRQENGVEIHEEMDWQGAKINSPYSVSKYFAEREVWRGYVEGLNVSVLNPSTILGDGDFNSGSSAIVDKVHEGLPFYPKGTGGFVDLRDVVEAVVKCLHKESFETQEGEHVGKIILNGFNISYCELFAQMSEKLGVKAPQRLLPDWLGGAFYHLEKIRAFLRGKRPVVTKETLRSSSRTQSYSNAKSRQLLDMKYRTVEETISYVCEAYLAVKGAK